MSAYWTVYTAPTTAPVVETITEDGVTLLEPEGYEVDADLITLGEATSGYGSTILTLLANKKGFALTRLKSKLDTVVPSRMLLVSYPEDGVCHAIHLPTTTLEGMPTENSMIVVGVRDLANEITMRRDFWFGENFRPEDFGFSSTTEEKA